jgi:hypothetical protein
MRIQRRWLCLAWPLALFALAGAPAAAGDGPPQGGAAAAATSRAQAVASVSFAVFRPVDRAVREMYGSGALPVTAQFEYPAGRRLRPFVGFRWSTDRGRTVAAGSSPGTLAYGLTLRTSSIRGGVLVGLPLGRVDVALGGGISANWYDERWSGASLAASGHHRGAVIQASLRTAVTRRLLAMARLEYSSIPNVQRVADTDLARVDLGGLEVGAGLGFRF